MEDKSSVALVPSLVRDVSFYDDQVPVALVDNVAYVALRPIADFLDLVWSSQYQRIQRDEILREEARLVAMTGADGRQRNMYCLPLELLPGWLFGVTPSKAKPELIPKLTMYRRECFRVLWRAFQADVLADTSPVSAPQESQSLVQVRNIALAVAQMADQQIELQSQVATIHARVDHAAVVVGDLQKRLRSIERRVEPAATISNVQAAEISNTVKALAELLSKQDQSKNHYQSIFAELYRRFEVSSYKLIRQDRYQEVLQFLESWRQSIL